MKKVIISQLSIQDNSLDLFLNLAKTMVEQSNAEEGCLVYKLLNVYNTTNEFFIYEEFTSEEAVEVHNSSTHFKQFLNAVMPILAKEPSIQMF